MKSYLSSGMNVLRCEFGWLEEDDMTVTRINMHLLDNLECVMVSTT